MEAKVLFRIVWMLLEVQEVVFLPIRATPTLDNLKKHYSFFAMSASSPLVQLQVTF